MRTVFLVAATSLALVVLVLARAQPEALTLLKPCRFLAWTGAPCPTCGTTHAAVALSHGRFADALAANPLATAAMMLLGPAAAASVLLRKVEIPPRARRILAWGGGLLVVLNWGYLLAR